MLWKNTINNKGFIIQNIFKTKEKKGMALIKCPHCGREVSQNAMVCPGCGMNLANNSMQKYSSNGNVVTYNKPNRKGIGFLVIGFIAAAAIIVIGVLIYTNSVGISYQGSSAVSTKFGGDFYTSEHEATCIAANNVYKIGYLIEDIFKISGIVIAAFGTCLASFFAYKIRHIL